LDSPKKASKKDIITVIDDEPLPESPESLTENAENDILPIRRQFVGEVDLPESGSTLSCSLVVNIFINLFQARSRCLKDLVDDLFSSPYNIMKYV
jgi:hypothetical protein